MAGDDARSSKTMSTMKAVSRRLRTVVSFATFVQSVRQKGNGNAGSVTKIVGIRIEK